ncbi:MAG: metallophosphoesterase family protein [Desulfobacca sp.]|uniref:metallophosphoesterase family protein n=1 Tax=Desulfobacca sp. TaxID=2067990 RepID=UPI0040493210
MISRRRFLQQVGAGLAAGAWGWSLGSQPLRAGPPPHGPDGKLRLALLSDAHLSCTPTGRTAIDNLLAAVAEINAVQPAVDLVFFLGDLAEGAEGRALALGREILATLSAPCWLLPGDHDPRGVTTESRGGLFSFTWRGVHFCGLDTRSGPTSPSGPPFQLGQLSGRWLANEIKRLPPEVPLFILSHAPLYPVFRPWQWWTAGTAALPSLFGSRSLVLLLHGHVHQHIRLQMDDLIFQGVRSTAWPLPDVHIGTPAECPLPGKWLGRTGCGWLLLTVADGGQLTWTDQCWQA